MSDDSQQPIVVKRIKKGSAHHGGAWKIAYADFVTAMMAFFLLMWLLSNTSQGDLRGIEDYFKTPLKIAFFGGEGTGDSKSIIKGGGEDITRSYGQVKRGGNVVDKKAVNIDQAVEEFEKLERKRLEDLKRMIEKMIDENPTLKQFKSQILLDLTSEGLRIQIVDEKNRPMFDLSSSELKPYTRVILHEIGRMLNNVENRISLAGHTDATPYVGGDKGFGNWELSTNRANASRRELIGGGMDELKVLRTVGLASTVLYDKQDPYNPINRRISIVVLNKRTEEAILRDGNVVDVGNAADLSGRNLDPPPTPGR